MQLQANMAIVNHLMAHEQYLASDKLEGRRTGTNGELFAMQYIENQYREIGIEPKGNNGFLQEFDIDEGKNVEGSFLKVNNNSLSLHTDFFPLAYSATDSVKALVSVDINEKDQPWCIDLANVVEDNVNNPHFDIETYIKKMAVKIAEKHAKALLLYNSSNITDNVLFNKNDQSAVAPIPVVYITQHGFKKYFTDPSATNSIELNVSIHSQTRKARNIIGFINNHAPNTVILGAHYDHLGYGEDKNALDTVHAVHNGADDNASGTAALIELARLLKQSSPKNNNYLIINFSAEELGLLGSKYWLNHPTITINPNYMVNMDMVGRYDSARKLIIGGYGTSATWSEIVTTIHSNLLLKFDSTGSGPSDHEAFYRKDIPVLFFFTGTHPDYHKATDDWDKINYNGEREIIQFIYQLITAADTKGKLMFTKTSESAMGRGVTFSVSLGVIPDYAFSGTGVRIDGVAEGKLAQKIGLQSGDILLQLGNYKFVDLMSYMQTLSKFKKGDKTQLLIKRATKEIIFDIEFQ